MKRRCCEVPSTSFCTNLYIHFLACRRQTGFSCSMALTSALRSSFTALHQQFYCISNCISPLGSFLFSGQHIFSERALLRADIVPAVSLQQMYKLYELPERTGRACCDGLQAICLVTITGIGRKTLRNLERSSCPVMHDDYPKKRFDLCDFFLLLSRDDNSTTLLLQMIPR